MATLTHWARFSRGTLWGKSVSATNVLSDLQGSEHFFLNLRAALVTEAKAYCRPTRPPSAFASLLFLATIQRVGVGALLTAWPLLGPAWSPSPTWRFQEAQPSLPSWDMP